MQQSNVHPRTERLQDIELAKGLAIFLVVLGHIVAREPPANNQWYVVLKAAIYLFHMPFFMYLSGYVTFLTGAASAPLKTWGNLVKKRAFRLLLPFFIFGLVIIAGKIVLSQFIFVDNKPGSIGQAIMDILWYTDRSPATSVWYIAVLFMYCIVTPLLMRLSGERVYLILAASVILYFVSLPHVMYLDRFARYYAFFVFGGLAVRFGSRWGELIDKYATISLLIFLAVVSFVVSSPRLVAMPNEMLFICGFLSIPALHGLVRMHPFSRSGILLIFGSYSFVIYLLNTPFIGLVKGLLLRNKPWDGKAFLLFAPLLLAAGLGLPILLKRYVFRHVPWLDRFTS